jgi:hypothetical protein
MVLSLGRRGSKRRVFTLVILCFLFWYLYFDGVDVSNSRDIKSGTLRLPTLSNEEEGGGGGRGYPRVRSADSAHDCPMIATLPLMTADDHLIAALIRYDEETEASEGVWAASKWLNSLGVSKVR